MIKLFTEEEYELAKYKDLLKLKCEFCDKIYQTTKHQIVLKILNKYKKSFCSKRCQGLCIAHNRYKDPSYVKKGFYINCKNCSKQVYRRPSETKKSNNIFCGSSCAAIYNNAHKTQGYRTSKLESFVQTKLTALYPNLEIHFNRKDAINSELDFYIPSLKLAFELNGIFHYEPIYGNKKLEQTQNNDQRKFAACAEKGISLCVIDTSKQKRFTEKSSQEYLEIILKIINDKMSKN